MTDILELDIKQGREVAALKSKFLDDFFKGKEKELFELFCMCPIGDADKLVQIHTQAKSLNALRTAVDSAMDSAKMAQVAVDKLNK